LLEPGAVRRGAMLVHPRPRSGKYGHIGIVTHVGPDGRATRVLHCSAGNFERDADAISETDTAAFDDPRLGAVAARYRFLKA